MMSRLAAAAALRTISAGCGTISAGFAQLADALEGDESGGVDLIDQHHPSSLGRRKQPPIVRARRARGDHGAFILGRRYCLSPQALAEERERLSGGKLKVSNIKPATSVDVRSELEAELRLVRGGRR